MGYSISLPAWSVGTDCYQEVYRVASRFGRKAAVIGGKTAMEKAYGRMKESLAGTDLVLTDPIWFGGNATYENSAKLEAMEEVRNADMIFAVGGGRAVDTCKCAAAHLDKPLFTFPTLASNCAGCTSIAIMYNEDDTFRDIMYPARCPQHTFLNMDIISRAPAEFLWAGIGDSLAKEYESEFASRGKSLFHTTLLGTQIARSVTGPLMEYSAEALELNRARKTGFALEQAALAIVITAGLVSNMTIGPTGTEYFYNSSVSHSFYYGTTIIPASGGRHLHGEIVAYGTLVLLACDRQYEKLDRLIVFNHSVGLPVTMAEIDLKEADLPPVAEKASTVTEWDKVPYEVTKEMFVQAILDVDARGRKYLAGC